MVQLRWAHEATDVLSEVGVKNVAFKLYQGMPHSVSMEELADVQQFLVEAIGDESSSVTDKDRVGLSLEKAGVHVDAKLGERASELADKQQP